MNPFHLCVEIIELDAMTLLPQLIDGRDLVEQRRIKGELEGKLFLQAGIIEQTLNKNTGLQSPLYFPESRVKAVREFMQSLAKLAENISSNEGYGLPDPEKKEKSIIIETGSNGWGKDRPSLFIPR